MNFADAIAIIITSPFLVAVTNGGMGTNNVIVALPFIRIDSGSPLSEGVDVFFQSLLVGVMDQPEPDLATLAANCAHNRGAIIIVSAVSTPFVGPPPWGVVWIAVIVTFFPPRSETSRQFQSVHRARGFGAGPVGHWLEFLAGLRAWFGD